MRFALCRPPVTHSSPSGLLGNVACNIICALRTTSLVTSLSQDVRNLSSSGEGFGASGEMTVRSHFAVVIAVLTGVAAIFEFALPGMPLGCDEGER